MRCGFYLFVYHQVVDCVALKLSGEGEEAIGLLFSIKRSKFGEIIPIIQKLSSETVSTITSHYDTNKASWASITSPM